MKKKASKNPFVCKYGGCEKHFKAEQTLMKHEKTHTQYNSLVCTYCHKHVILSKYLNDCIPSHTGAISFFCITCGGAFPSAASLIMHQNWHQQLYDNDISDYIENGTDEEGIIPAMPPPPLPSQPQQPQPQPQQQQPADFQAGVGSWDVFNAQAPGQDEPM